MLKDTSTRHLNILRVIRVQHKRHSSWLLIPILIFINLDDFSVNLDIIEFLILLCRSLSPRWLLVILLLKTSKQSSKVS